MEAWPMGRDSQEHLAAGRERDLREVLALFSSPTTIPRKWEDTSRSEENWRPIAGHSVKYCLDQLLGQ